MALLELENVIAAYGHLRALKGLTLAVAEGEIVALLGANGAGKSTTLRVISGLMAPQSGALRFGGRAISMFLFGTEEKWRGIYPLREELGLFYLGGKIAARREKLRRRIEAKEAAAQEARREREAENAA